MKYILYITLFFYTLIFPNKNIKKEIKETIPITIKNDSSIGSIQIPKINLEEKLFKKNSEENTIEKHVTILEESTLGDKENGILLLAAHSGTGKIAYFEELDELEINDEITILYKEKKYIFQVKEIWEELKNGFIHINKEKENQLILTTCSPNKKNYQLIINCIEKRLE